MDYPIKTPQQLGQVLKGLRRDKGLTQQMVGALIGLMQSEISWFEANPGRSSVERLFRFLSALELELLIRDRKAPQPPAKKSRSKKVEW